jgi:mono/diheme cytochrome c family protein
MKAKHGIIVVLFSVLIILSGKQALSADTSAGKIIFKNNCQVCHMVESDGNYPSAYYRQYRPKDFSKSISWENLTEKKIRLVLLKGQKVMRPVPLTDAETKALIDYMMNDLRKQSPDSYSKPINLTHFISDNFF